LTWLLEKTDIKGRVQKRVYIDCCDYQIWKIEYLDENETPTLFAELYDYRSVKDSFYLPRGIRIARCDSGADVDLLEFEIDSVTPRGLEDVVFERPPWRGFKHEVRIINGSMSE